MTPWRRRLYKQIGKQSLSGKVLDIGGSRLSGYHELFQGTYSIEVNNIAEKEDADHQFDLEQVFPLPTAEYDAVLAMNVLEHVYRYEHVLRECKRVLKPGGKIVLAVPFLMFVHPSPHDHWRFTNETLTRLFEEIGFRECNVTVIGGGVGTVVEQLLGGLKGGAFLRVAARPALAVFDFIFGAAGSDLSKSERFPLGYVVVAKK